MSEPTRKIYWTAQEKVALARAALPYIAMGMSNVAAVTVAQNAALPVQRRRKVTGNHMIAWLPPLLESARKQLSEEATHSVPPTPAHTEDPRTRAAHALMDTLTVLLEVIRPTLIDIVKEALADLKEPPVGKGDKPQATLPTKSYAEEFAQSQSSSGRGELPKVLVAGLIGKQIAILEKEFAGRANLKFWQSSEALAQLKRTAKQADLCIGVTSFIPHSADSMLKQIDVRYLRHGSGVAALQNVIHKELEALRSSKGSRSVSDSKVAQPTL